MVLFSGSKNQRNSRHPPHFTRSQQTSEIFKVTNLQVKLIETAGEDISLTKLIKIKSSVINLCQGEKC